MRAAAIERPTEQTVQSSIDISEPLALRLANNDGCLPEKKVDLDSFRVIGNGRNSVGSSAEK